MRITQDFELNGGHKVRVDGKRPFSGRHAGKAGDGYVMVDAAGINCVRFHDGVPAVFPSNMEIVLLAARLNEARQP